MRRQPLPEPVIERIRRDRHAPRRTQWDYLHLSELLDALREARDRFPMDSPILDLYCGTRPYRDLWPGTSFFGLDVDRHFGRADVVGTLPLPFRSGSLGSVVCTQALYLVPDPVAVVEEMRRVVRPGGGAIVTVPAFRPGEVDHERRFTPHDLGRLFAGWADTRVEPFGGPAGRAAFRVGKVVAGVARRWRGVASLLPAISATLNGVAAAVGVVTRPLETRVPGGLLLTARRAGPWDGPA